MFAIHDSVVSPRRLSTCRYIPIFYTRSATFKMLRLLNLKAQTKLNHTYFKIQLVTPSKDIPCRLYTADQLMLHMEIIAACSESHTKHRNTLCGQNIEFLDAFVKLRKATINFIMSVCPSIRLHGTTRLPLYGLSWNLIFQYFSTACPSGRAV